MALSLGGARNMKPYNVVVTQVGHWWLIEVPDLDASTQSRRFAEVEHRARQLMADTLDVPLATVAVGTFHLELGGLDIDLASDELAKLSGLPQQRSERRSASQSG